MWSSSVSPGFTHYLAVPLKMTREQHSLTVAMDQTTEVCRMQDDCLDVSNKPFYKCRKKLIPPPRGASFRAQKITLMLTCRLYYGGAVITSITVQRHMIFQWCTFPVVHKSSGFQWCTNKTEKTHNSSLALSNTCRT